MRDPSVDAGRGLLVVMMIYGHVLQFFADTQIFPLAGHLITLINLTVFPAFVFYFGMTASLAYLYKPFRQALPGMARTTSRAYVVFVLSGIGYRVLRENKLFGPGTVRRVMLLTDIPGWSEFLIAFALYGALLMAGFALFRWISGRPCAALVAGALCVACCLIPYERVTVPQLSLLIGGTQFSYFPVVQYMPYFLAGLVYARANRQIRLRLLALAALCTGLAALCSGGVMPSRFPPQWTYILLSSLPVAAVVLAGHGIALLCEKWAPMRIPANRLLRMGGSSLYYLCSSNLVLFAMAGRGIVPQTARKSILPWTLPIQSPQGALCWTLVLLAALGFLAALAGRGTPRAR